MKLYIDGKAADTDGSRISVSFSFGSVKDPGKSSAGYSGSVTIPMTNRNREIMDGCEEIHAAERFNDRLHAGRVELAGCTVLEGPVYLAECVKEEYGAGYYRLRICDGAKLWAEHAAANKLSTLYPGFSMEVSGDSIRESWTSSSAVKFLPVQRDGYNFAGADGGVLKDRTLAISDYHPFFRVESVLREIFNDAGYTLESDFIGGDYFRSLYMSGSLRLPDGGSGSAESKMGFRAGRFAEATATADHLGRVYANPYSDYNTIGNIVDTADPNEERNGVRIPGVYDNGGCFGRTDRRVAFVPASEVSAGFRFKLRYETGYKIKNGAELDGFNKIYLGADQGFRITIPNKFPDRKFQFRANKEFRCVVANHSPSYVYRMTGVRITNPAADPENLGPGDFEEVPVAEFTGRSAPVSTNVQGNYAYALLYFKESYSSAFGQYIGEWMLYDGYVEETGVTEVEVELTTAPKTLNAGSPKYFDDIFFDCGEYGTRLTLRDAVLTPVFHTEGYAAPVSFGDICPADVRRMDVVDAARHMFNLNFYTDSLEKKVYAEPRVEFGDGPEVDWSGRVDRSRPVVLQETGAEGSGVIVYRYAGGDGAVGRFDEENGDRMGEWRAELSNLSASGGEEVRKNALFTPSRNSAGRLASAPSASLLNAGDNGGRTSAGGKSDFPVKVVRYMGMAGLPDGEKWSWPSNGPQYPLLAFHYPSGGSGFTLCFEDRDGVPGLHRYYDAEIGELNRSRRLTAWIRLDGPDIEPFAQYDTLKHDFRARFRLRIAGERSLWRLEEVCGYDPSAPSTKCVFVKI